MENIVLGDNQIESLINGNSIQVTLSDGKTILIRQSFMKDLAAPIINYDKKIYSKQEINNIKAIASSLAPNSLKLGV